MLPSQHQKLELSVRKMYILFPGKSKLQTRDVMGLGKMQILKNAKSAASAKMAQVSKAVKPKKADEDSKSKADELAQIYDEQKAELQGSDHDDTILALDIGTENVKAVIARQNKSGGLDIIGIGRAR